jgi:DNA-binding MarR family transcriptional regulator
MEKLHLQLNQVIHQPIRLQIMTFLHLAKNAKFSQLKKELGITDGNLGAHLAKLEEKKYIKIKKKIILNKPSSTISITEKGECELIGYLKVIKSFLK